MESDEAVIRQYKAYRAAKGLNTEPDPNSIPCPDCQGNGVHVKKIPILGIKVGKICKACGGTGYVNSVNL